MSLNEVISNPEPIELKVITPLFLGNAYQDDINIMNSQSELRPPSLKGVLRFWHRAANPDNLNTEAEYFGNTDGQGCFLLQVENPLITREPQKWEYKLGYLGYGPIMRDKKSKELQSRQYIKPGETLKLRLVFRPDASAKAKEAVFRSFRLLNLFGGLGSRSRRGFGSVILEKDMPTDVSELISQIRSELVQYVSQRESKYTAISQLTRVVIPFVKTSWEEALESIEQIMHKYRSSDKFEQDVDLVKQYLENGTIEVSPQRVSFGLPHNYSFVDIKRNVTIEPFHSQYSRRASPLFIHVHELGDKRFAVVVSFFPAPLLPKGISLQVKEVANNERKVQTIKKYCTVPTPEDLAPVNEFMDYLRNLKGAQEVNWRS